MHVDITPRSIACHVSGCNGRKVIARGMCRFHYSRWWRLQTNPDLTTLEAPKFEKQEGPCGYCSADAISRGMCAGHWARWRKGKRGAKLSAPLRVCNPGAKCAVDGCSRTQTVHSYCRLHYKRFRTHGDPGPAALLRRSAGEGTLYSGYRVFQTKTKRGLEHRIVMRDLLGRELESWEHVHHRNGIKSDLSCGFAATRPGNVSEIKSCGRTKSLRATRISHQTSCRRKPGITRQRTYAAIINRED